MPHCAHAFAARRYRQRGGNGEQRNEDKHDAKKDERIDESRGEYETEQRAGIAAAAGGESAGCDQRG